MKTGPRTHDEYLAGVGDDKRAALEKLRRTIKSAAPAAEERISYGIAVFHLNGMLVGFGASASHCAFYLMSSTVFSGFARELEGYDVGKGTIRFAPDEPLPATLVRMLVRARIAENEGRPRRARARSRR